METTSIYSKVLCKSYKTTKGLKIALGRYISKQTKELEYIKESQINGSKYYLGEPIWDIINELEFDITKAQKEFKSLTVDNTKQIEKITKEIKKEIKKEIEASCEDVEEHLTILNAIFKPNSEKMTLLKNSIKNSLKEYPDFKPDQQTKIYYQGKPRRLINAISVCLPSTLLTCELSYKYHKINYIIDSIWREIFK